jgi:hypothetical protein
MITFVHPAMIFAETPPAIVRVADPVAPAAGAAGSSDAGTSAAPSTRRTVKTSANGGQLAGKAVPGGTNKAPTRGKKPGSFSAPAKND